MDLCATSFSPVIQGSTEGCQLLGEVSQVTITQSIMLFGALAKQSRNYHANVLLSQLQTGIRLAHKGKALAAAEALHSNCHYYKIYCDGSGFEKKIGASTLLYIGNRLSKTLHFHLGPEDKHTVYEAESVSLLMGLHMLKNVSLQMRGIVLLGLDSQALSRSLGNQSAHPGQYLIDEIHTYAECLQAKQDGIINAAEKRASLLNRESWKGRTRGVIDLQLHWIPAHSDFKPNERADEEAKCAVQSLSSDATV